MGFSSDYERSENAPLKRIIAEYAAKSLIKEGDSLFLGPGTTVLALAGVLPSYFRALTLYTNAIDILSHSFSNFKFKMRTSGGELSTTSSCLFGVDAENTLKSWRVDKVFLEADAIVPEIGGIMVINNMESTIIPYALHLAPKVYVLADSTKFGKLALYKIASFGDITAVVTNVLPDEVRKKLASQLRIIQVPDI